MALRLCLLILAFSWAPPPLWSQGFGQNHVVIRDFDWKVVSTEHFDIHYYEGSAAWVPFAAQALERSYQKLHGHLDTGFKERRPFFLYGSVNEMQQSNIADIGDGTGGVTEAFKDRFMVYNDGSRQWLDTVATHELAHVFQFHVLISGFWKSVRILKTVVYPLWMMEGMAEYFTEGLDDSAGEIIVRDAATSKGLIPLFKLEHFNHLKPHQIRLAYETGSAVLEFLESQYGKGKVADMLKMFESRFESSPLLQELIGLDIFAFDKKWREYAEQKYEMIVRKEKLQEPQHYGSPLTESQGELPEFNASQVFTPDDRRMAYLSTRDGHPPALMLKNLETGRVKRLVSGDTRVENLHLGNFANISRVLALSPDGRYLAFAAKKNQRDSIYLYDLNRGRLEKIPLPGFQSASAPAFSPDGKQLAFSGMKEGFTDIYLLDRTSRQIRPLTSDPADDQSPNFSPDGRHIVYSSEVEIPGDSMPYQRRLYRVTLDNLSVERLSDVRGAARDPVYSPDGSRILFSLERDGFYEIYELEAASRGLKRLTKSIGASYTPSYTPSGDIAFSGFRRGSIHIYRGARARFLSEPDAMDQSQAISPPRSEVTVSTAFPTYSSERPYRPSYSTDLFLPALFYSSNGGLFWTSYWQGSDMLGNHGAQALISYASGRGFLNYQTRYTYGRFRPQWSAGASGITTRDNFDRSSGRRVNESAHTQFLGLSYPLDRFHRLDFTAAVVTDRKFFQDTKAVTHGHSRIGRVAFVRDTVRGRYLVANQGSRLRLAYLTAPRILGANSDYQSYSLEAHQYLRTGNLSALFFRFLGVESVGRNTPQQILGGLGGVRGYGRSTIRDAGSRLAVANMEWRFPILKNLDYYMWYIFPDFYFKAITAALFSDAGFVWRGDSQIQRLQLRDIRHSYGIGLRIHTFVLQLFPLVLHLDYARRTTSDGGVFYVYLGPLF